MQQWTRHVQLGAIQMSAAAQQHMDHFVILVNISLKQISRLDFRRHAHDSDAGCDVVPLLQVLFAHVASSCAFFGAMLRDRKGAARAPRHSSLHIDWETLNYQLAYVVQQVRDILLCSIRSSVFCKPGHVSCSTCRFQLSQHREPL